MKYRVLAVDDSAFMRQLLSDLLKSSPLIEAVETAINGKDALRKIKEFKPDVITLDIEMPIMNGIDALQEIMKTEKIPVIMCSTLTAAGAEITIKALEIGAFDFIEKPPSLASDKIDEMKKDLLNKVITAASRKIKPLKRIEPQVRFVLPTLKRSLKTTKLVVIGTSTGGPQALKEVLPYLPKDFPANIIVVQHMPAKFTEMFAKRLDGLCEISVKEAKEDDTLKPGLAFIAPGGYHLELENKEKISLNQKPHVCGVRPSVNLTLESAATIYKDDLICVILTGMGHDGTQGSSAVKTSGGFCIAEDESTCTVFGMPKNVIKAGNANEIVPIHKVANSIIKAVYS